MYETQVWVLLGLYIFLLAGSLAWRFVNWRAHKEKRPQLGKDSNV